VAAGAVEAAPEAADGDSDSVRRDRIAILGIPLDVHSRNAALELLYCGLHAEAGEIFTVTTLNPEYVMAARKQPGFREAIAGSDLIVCDGVGTLLAARVLDRHASARLCRLTGLELTSILAKWSAYDDTGGLFLLGGKNATAAADRLAERVPNARVVGAWSGGTPDSTMDEASVQRIRSSGASVVLVAYGAPGQVLWIERNRNALGAAGVKVAIGVGGAIDYLSGDSVLAPEHVRRLGLEWLFRLAWEPRRIRRQIVLPRFALLVVKEAMQNHFGVVSSRFGGSRELDRS
jgi:N-acetylglucosaminyldiphosphoundecaprenol N-acetyl-beta-D-mannosaminyltransferase